MTNAAATEQVGGSGLRGGDAEAKSEKRKAKTKRVQGEKGLSGDFNGDCRRDDC